MRIRSILCLFLALAVTACSGTNDRYAFWRDDKSNNPYSADNNYKPNLGDVPTPPNADSAKAEMDSMRQRMEQDRDNAYREIEGRANGVPSAAATMPAIQDDALPAVTAPMGDQQSMNQTDDMNYVYDSSKTVGVQEQDYVYGYSPVNIRSQDQGAMMPMEYADSSDPSISIDWSALGGDTNYASGSYGASASGVSSLSLSGEPLIFFNHGSARLGSKDRQKLKALADRIRQNPNAVTLVGYASRQTGINNVVTSRKVNLDMSAKRSFVVLQELARFGVQPEQVKLAAYGDSMQSSNDKFDRRVDILFQ